MRFFVFLHRFRLQHRVFFSEFCVFLICLHSKPSSFSQTPTRPLAVTKLATSHTPRHDHRLTRPLSRRRSIAHIRGDTNTASALRYMRTEMFTEKNGARSDIPHIAIVITDGKSNNPQITRMEAAKAQAEGIHMFAIGIGNHTDKSELYSLASQPDDHYVFTVEDYTALLYIEDIVAIKTCKGQYGDLQRSL